ERIPVPHRRGPRARPAYRVTARRQHPDGMSPFDHIRALRANDELVIIDGGTGTELEARGGRMDLDIWGGIVTLSDPDLVRSVHEDYIDAGADLIIANTFMTGWGPMKRAGLSDRFEDINRTGVRLAHEARERRAKDRSVAIAGSLCMSRGGAPDTQGLDDE